MGSSIREKNHEKTKSNASRLVLLLLIIFIIALIFTELVMAADIGDAFRNAGGRIGGFFGDYAETDDPSFLDFFVFAVIFFALCWVGFSTIFKEAKNASIALSVAVGFALSVALVYGGRFTMKKLLPFAMIILFLLIFIGIFAVFKKFIFTKDTVFSKVISVVVAIVVSIALLLVAWNFICSDGNCEDNAFMRKVFGSESVFGKVFGGISEAFTGEPAAPGATSADEKLAAQLCGNGEKDPGEECDPGGREGVPSETVGCGEGELCDNCERCVKQTAAGTIFDTLGKNWIWIILALLLLLLLGLGGWKSKRILNKGRGWWARRKRRSELGALNRLFSKLEGDEKSLAHNIAQLIDNVKQEKAPFEASRHIVDNITRDIKQTIGAEIELIEQGKKQGLVDNVNRMHGLNHHEKVLIESHIVPTIQKELGIISSEFANSIELLGRINSIDNVHEHFEENSRIVESFKHYNFREKNVINNMINDLEENEKQFKDFKEMCGEMLTLLDDEANRITRIREGRIGYHDVIESIKVIRRDAIRLNQLFASKVNLLRYIIRKMEQLKQDVQVLHDAELENLKEFLRKAGEAKGNQNYDTAMYFASHVVENAQFLVHNELSKETRDGLKGLENEAKNLVRECIPKVLTSVLPKIAEELDDGKFDEVKTTLRHIGRIEFLDKDLNSELEIQIKEYRFKMEEIEHLCEDMEQVDAATGNLHSALGLPAPS